MGQYILVLDTCAERVSMALARLDGALVAEELLPPRSASTMLLSGVRTMLGRAGVGVGALAGVGVVHGPGSFTGVRVGLAFAKGLCEAAQLPLAAVSRLQVLAEAGENAAIAVLSAGRDQVYVRVRAESDFCERLLTDAALQEQRRGEVIAVDSHEMAARFASGGPVQQIELTAAHAISRLLQELRQGGCDPAGVDANYVRQEDEIYRRATGLNLAEAAVPR